MKNKKVEIRVMHKQAKSAYLLQELKKRVGTMCAGERFPSVRELMKEYGVSQFSLTPAINRLEEEAMIERIVGKGTFVAQNGSSRAFRLCFLQSDWAIDEFSFHSETRIRQIAAERHYGYRKIMYQDQDEIFEHLPYDAADAIVISPCRWDFSARQIEILLNAPIPVIVFRAGFPHSNINFVNGDNVASGIMAASHFIDRGHRQLALLKGEPDSPTERELCYGYCSYAESKGATVTVIDCQTRYGQLSAHNTYTVFKEYCRTCKLNFRAMLVSSDSSALGALKALADNQIRIPEDLQVMSFGGSPQVELYQPSLSTVETQIPKMANAVFEIIDQCAAEGKTHGISRLVYPSIIERESTRLT